MKTIKFSLVTLLFISFLSCTEDDSPSTDTSMVTGTWNIEAFDYSGTSSGNFEGIDMTINYSGVAENIDATLTFNQNNTFNFEGSYDVALTTEGFTQTVHMSNVSSTGSWEKEGDYLITTGAMGQVQGQGVPGPQESEMWISEISENRMELIIDQETMINQNGIDFTVKTNGRYLLTR